MAGKTLPLAASLTLALVFASPLPAAAVAGGGTQIPGLAGPYLAAEDAAHRSDVAAAAHWYSEALKADPNNQSLLAKAIIQHVAAGEMEAAVSLAQRLESLNPGQNLADLVLAVEAIRKGEPGRAQKLLAPADQQAGPFVGQLITAWAEFAEGKTDAARTLLTKLGEKNSAGAAGDIVAAYHLALLEAAAGKDKAALAAIDHTAELAKGTDDRLTRVRAGILARLGRFDEAKKAVKQQKDATLGNPELESLAASLAQGKAPPPLVKTGSQGAAEALFGVAGFLARGSNRQISLAYVQLAVYLDPDLMQGWLLIGDILNEAGQYDLAIAAYQEVPHDAPVALQAAIGRAQALEAAGRRDEAIGILRETAATHPKELEAQIALGDMLRRAERWSEAADSYGTALALIKKPQERHWVLYYEQGIAYERSNQWDKAQADFLEALKLKPDQPLVLNYLGYSWVEQGKHIDKAQAMIKKAVAQRPDDGYIVDSLGWVEYRLGQYKQAAKNMEHAVELEPTDPVINDHYGDVLWMVGRKTEARFQWKRALSFNPDQKEAERIHKKLAQGLDAVLAEEKAAGQPAVLKSTAGTAKPNGG